MEIKNLSQMKRAINARTPFKIVNHFNHPEFIGQIRIPNVIQTNGCYTIVRDEPENYVSTANFGKGYWFKYGKASDWVFENGTCTNIIHRNGKNFPVWEIKLL